MMAEYKIEFKKEKIRGAPVDNLFFSPVIILLFFLLLLSACSSEPDNQAKGKADKALTQEETRKKADNRCLSCHAYKLDMAHREIKCTSCHQGKSPAPSQKKAHQNLISKPAHPDYMMQKCGGCHPDQVKAAGSSLHFTLAGEINTIRQAFGANESLASLLEIPINHRPDTALELADDLLRRRCLRCHVYWPGDLYRETSHGTGCAACHLPYQGGNLSSHLFMSLPSDRQCLHCHYGNHVGGDYYGFFEHDFHWAYRTPYQEDGWTPERPYGVENHPLSPDIHQKAGLACIDCHDGRELMSADSTAKISCRTCHQVRKEEINKRENLNLEDGKLLLTTKFSGKNLEVRQLQHPAHEKYGEKVSCQVCHSKWGYNDIGTHFIRLDLQNYEPWGNLEVQSSFEAEAEITDFLYGEGKYPYPFMQDKITGQSSRGLWLKGFELRRWETPLVCRDEKGKLQVCRPVLDLHLSWVNEEGEVIFDAVTPEKSNKKGLLPYAPHTIGHAGPFFRQRLKENNYLLEEPYFLPITKKTGKNKNE